MRQIKFRTWDDRYNEMIYIDDFYFFEEHGIHSSSDCLLMQFTGLLDKNDKEIYEGDIIRSVSMLSDESTAVFQGVVIYKNDSFIIDGKSIHILFSAHCNLMLNLENKEVIGNIYENPELLEK